MNNKHETNLKRLGKTDMHTMYDIVFTRLEKLSTKELLMLQKSKSLSKETKDKINGIICKRLDPQDRDIVEM